ncbi:glycerol-3-phosphate 1-O-acyltransferase PlsY [Methylocapsa palsarum]|uniref:glycerol-3-phosphate 1-O-acyltransferase PlsY n=1 Tax=Methylocapsa palsarum TaxID=1612308 RepID=UPI001587DBE3|nr:glycerol-3-phosphate 1-O-acyltransferase PlsY [Methylocapsa palsarum]
MRDDTGLCVQIILGLIFGYVCGSIPFGLIVSFFGGTKDPRSIGSGNIGATNVLRTGRKDLAALTLLLDMGKGAFAVAVVAFIVWRRMPPDSVWPPYAPLFAAFGAFIGHVYPIWLGFRGGKGVATFLGCLLALSWQAGLVFIGLWLVVAAVTRFSSLAALLASAAAPAYLIYTKQQPRTAGLFVLLALLLWYKHWPNIVRLVKGKETRIGKS